MQNAMKLNIRTLLFSMVMILSAEVYSQKVKAKEPNIDIRIFYNELTPYGQWVDYARFGYAWIPNVGSDFMPYATNGNWVLTDVG